MDHSGRFGLDAAQLSSTGPVCDAEEDVEGNFARVQLVCGDSNDLGEGNLNVTTRRIVWAKPGSSEGLAAAFLDISLHAVAQTENNRPCIYMQLERPGAEFSDDEGEERRDEDESCKELRLIPNDSNSVHDIFSLLSKCAALNPDGSEDEDDEGEFYYDGEEALGAGALDNRILDHLDSLLTMPRADDLDELLEQDPERFDDPDEEEEEDDEKMNGHTETQ